ncbi:hypothetical protein R3P38DRAFT_3275300 [Favolaschia claudopus]|uniref:Uncharacterized protein n=1 Tax=Favolaschia claudopus TaxID=2862362 RepID=A0AAW0AVA0_9AGAR
MAMVQEKEDDEGRRREDGERKRERRGSTSTRSRKDSTRSSRHEYESTRSRKDSTESLREETRRSSRRDRDGDRHHHHTDGEDGEDRHHRRRRDRDDRDKRRRSRSHDGDNTAAAAYSPEFLQSLAKANSPTKSEFDVITGQDAVRFARKFVREQASNSNLALALPPGVANSTRSTSLPNIAAADPQALDKKLKRTMPPVVFALPRSAAGNTGRRVVDLYLSWRGKTKPVELTGRSRRKGFLDNEFQKVKEVLDGEWRRASRAIKGAVCAPDGSGNVDDHGHGGPSAVALARAPTDPQPHPRLPPLLAQMAKDEHRENNLTAPPAARSVSDPFPVVTHAHNNAHNNNNHNNQAAYPLPSSFPINTERPPMGAHRGSVDSLTSVTSLPLLGMVRGVPLGNRVGLHVTNFSPNDRMSMSMSSDRGSVVDPPLKMQLTKSSPLREGVAFVAPPSVPRPQEAPASTTPALPIQLPGRTASESSASSEGSTRSHKSRSSRTSKAARHKDEDKILIVLLDENEMKDKSPRGGRERKLALPVDDDGEATWHGLERRLSTRSGRKPSPPTSSHQSPWLGPLVNLDDDVTYLHTPPHSDDSDSDDEEDEDGDRPRPGPGAIVPIQNVLSAMGYLAPEAAVMGGTPSPYGSYANLSAGYTSPYPTNALASYTSPYVSPQVQGSPYRSLPPSRPRTPVAYSTTSPTGQPLPPLYLTPGTGTVYPPTAYTSPTAAYPAMSPAMAPGYVSPYAAASPLGGYSPNLGATYSSPYVPPLQGAPLYYS